MWRTSRICKFLLDAMTYEFRHIHPSISELHTLAIEPVYQETLNIFRAIIEHHNMNKECRGVTIPTSDYIFDLCTLVGIPDNVIYNARERLRCLKMRWCLLFRKVGLFTLSIIKRSGVIGQQIVCFYALERLSNASVSRIKTCFELTLHINIPIFHYAGLRMRITRPRPTSKHIKIRFNFFLT